MCWRRYEFSRKRRLVSFKKPERMEKGTVGHKILAYYYTEVGLNLSRPEPKSRELVIEEAFKIGTLEAAKTDLGRDMLNKLFEDTTSYFQHYAREDWLPLLDDNKLPLVEVPLTKILYEREDEPEVEGVRVIFNGIIDLIIAPTKNVPIRIVDHKFKDRFSELDPLSNQLSLYSAVTGIPDVIRNDVGGQKEGNVNKYRRQHFKYHKTQQDENLRWAIYWALEADYHESVGIYPPNPTSCDKFGGCVYADVCNTMPSGREGVINANFKTGTRHSIYEDDAKPQTPVVEGSTEAEPGTVPIETVAPAPIETPTEEVPVVREAGEGVRDDVKDGGVDGELEAVPGLPEVPEARGGLRDGESADTGSAPEATTEENFADSLLKRLGF